ncbi:hypothetical protein GGI13_000641 [Coemansia sp. RSA 455]|nr:hypothetical protein GGI13_000641 [Coemansia sp. RSA 455]
MSISHKGCLQSSDEYEDPQVVARQNKLARTLEKLDTRLKFPDLLRYLELTAEYKSYRKATRGLFADNTEGVPTLGNDVAEATFINGFFDVVRFMRNQAKKSRLERCPQMTHEIFNGQRTSLSGTELKPDVLFIPNARLPRAFSSVSIVLEAKKWTGDADAYLAHIGQLADYALELRACQPMRKYIPVFFLYGHELDLVVFTHRGYLRTYIGPVLFGTDFDNRGVVSKSIGESLRKLWFFLTLPVEKFGFLFGSPKVLTRWRIDTSSVPTAVTCLVDNSEEADDDSEEANESEEADDFGSQVTDVIVGDPISRSVRIVGRCAYLFDATYKGNPAVLKLSWIQTNRLPEGAVYRALEEHQVPNIPKVYLSGIIIKNLDGYRLEFLVLEYCGVSVVDYIRGLLGNKKTKAKAAPEMTRYVRQVVSTLSEALAANVLHRDISSGNITVKGGNMYVIDWGCAKIIKRPDDEAFAKQLAAYWTFDWEEVIAAEELMDPFTGTPLYMSTRLLLEAVKRSIYDDLESLMYIVLDAFSDRPRTGNLGDQPLGFTFLSNKTAGYTRITCTLSDKCFLSCFGVNSDTASVPNELLMAMRRFLFFDNGKHIGARILENTDFPRVFDESAAVTFMGEANAKNIKSMVIPLTVQPLLSLEMATPAPSVPRIEQGPSISSAQGTLDGIIAMPGGDLSAEDCKGKGVDTAKPNTNGSGMETECAKIVQAGIKSPPSERGTKARGSRNVNPPTNNPPRTRSQAKVLLSKKENDVPTGNNNANRSKPLTCAKKRANDDRHQSPTRKAVKRTKKPTSK